MATDGQGSRSTLWSRYDAGELTAEELDARLKALDRAGDDPDAVSRALDGRVRIPNPRLRRRLSLLGAGVVVALLVAGGIAFLDDGGSPAAGARGPEVVVDGGGIVLEPLPVDCPELDEAVARFEDLDEDTPAANPALLSDPPALPEGYSISVEDDILVGSDPNVSMSVSAGNPPPLEILGRSLHGPLVVTMRAWVYASADDAGSAGMSVLRDAVCTYDIEPFDVPDRPDVLGSTVSGIIPTTAFASWRLAERRFSVAVEAGADGDPDATAAAQQLAGTIAAMELDAARTAPAG